YDLANEPVFEGDQTVSIRKKADGSHPAGKITTLTFVKNETPSIPSTPSIPIPPTNDTSTVVVDVKLGETDDTASKITIERTKDATGKVSDRVVFEAQKAADTIDKLKEAKKEEARIVIPYTEEVISDTTVSIPSKAVRILSEGEVSLKIDTQNAKIEIPKDSLKYANDTTEKDLYFRLVPIREEKEQNNIEKRATIEIASKNNETNNIAVIGVPIEIETNMPSSRVDIFLPLNGIEIPSDALERENFLEQLAIYIEHSDGDKELIEGKIVEDKDGTVGIQFPVTKFSTFTIVKTDAFQKSSSCNIKKVSVPTDATRKGRKIVAVVDQKKASLSVKLTVSKNATWSLYSDKKCTKKIKANRLNLSKGSTTGYIKVTAEDGKTNKVYTLTVKRKPASRRVVIVATKYDFADATAGSVLAGQWKGNVLRTGVTEQDAKKLTDYIKKHYKISDEIYIIGLGKAVNEKLDQMLKKEGYQNIKNIGGKDKYETAAKIAKEITLPKHVKAVLINGAIKPADLEDIQKVCVKNGYPILYVKKNSLGKATKEALKEIKPEEVFLIGGKGAISDQVVEELEELLGLTEKEIQRELR
ncbi:MAG: hypothetical protein PWP24_1690, partial [Clostridiales bacterium]|nr:hypothetical protein [Clostridiales bacterium]